MTRFFTLLRGSNGLCNQRVALHQRLHVVVAAAIINTRLYQIDVNYRHIYTAV